ncbi:MAG: hypothetical protein HDR18_00640 [Lachnospiraceae bacterium]|nr:hypothetical protein [Lachnospiraceae bacterium]
MATLFSGRLLSLVSLYPKILRIFLTFVLPWTFIDYYPTLLITEKI